MRIAMLCAVLLAAGGCTWVKMAPGGAQVRVARAGENLAAGCVRRGEISVSVKDRVGPYERNTIKVRDELETLARNEAPGMQADTVQPKTEPTDGEQRFTAWRCDGAVAPAAAAATAPPSTGAETRPLEQGEVETLPLDD